MGLAASRIAADRLPWVRGNPAAPARRDDRDGFVRETTGGLVRTLAVGRGAAISTVHLVGDLGR